MGLGTREGKLNFLKVKGGNIYVKDDDTEYQDVTGMLTDIRFQTSTFEGATIETMNVTLLSEDGETYVFPVRLNNRSWAQVCGALVTADLSQPITLNVGGEEYVPKGGTVKKIRTFIWVSQNHKTVQSLFRKDNAEAIGLPQWKKIKVGREEKWDNVEWEDFIRGYIDELVSKLPKQKVSKPTEDVPEDDYDDEPEETVAETKTVAKKSGVKSSGKVTTAKKAPKPVEEDDDDGLPF